MVIEMLSSSSRGGLVSEMLEAGTKCQKAQHHSHHVSDHLVSSNDGLVQTVFSGVCSVFSTIWGGIRSIFDKIFFCCPSSEKCSNSEKVKFQTLLGTTKQEFIDKRGSRNFVDWWQKTFDDLPKQLRDRLIKKDMEDWGRNKNLKDDALKKYVDDMFKFDDKRRDSLDYVRNLNSSTTGILDRKTFNPIDDEQVSALLEKVKDDLGRIDA